MMIDVVNYEEEKLTVDLVWANIFSILLLIPVVIVFGLPYYLVWGNPFKTDNMDNLFTLSPEFALNGALIILVIILGIVIHELIHGITWSIFTEKGFKSIKFGVLWKMLTPYCHCKEPLKVKQYIIGAIMPAIILGIIPAIFSIAIGNLGLLIFGMFFTMAAAGDFLLINLLRKEKKDNYVLDHPSEVGCFIYRKVDK